MIHVCPLFVLLINTMLKVLLNDEKREMKGLQMGRTSNYPPFTGFLYLKDHKGPVDLISTK